jgi:hypothetical protein
MMSLARGELQDRMSDAMSLERAKAFVARGRPYSRSGNTFTRGPRSGQDRVGCRNSVAAAAHQQDTQAQTAKGHHSPSTTTTNTTTTHTSAHKFAYHIITLLDQHCHALNNECNAES